MNQFPTQRFDISGQSKKFSMQVNNARQYMLSEPVKEGAKLGHRGLSFSSRALHYLGSMKSISPETRNTLNTTKSVVDTFHKFYPTPYRDDAAVLDKNTEKIMDVASQGLDTHLWSSDIRRHQASNPRVPVGDRMKDFYNKNPQYAKPTSHRADILANTLIRPETRGRSVFQDAVDKESQDENLYGV